MNDKCKKCKYEDRPKHIFPCSKCDKSKEDVPMTCYDCRFYKLACEKKGIHPCKDFEWW